MVAFTYYTQVFTLLSVVAPILGNIRVPFAWRNIEFSYQNEMERENAIQNGSFIPENVVLNDVDVWEDSNLGNETGGYRIFVTTPRVRDGIPATLSTITSERRGESFLLAPFPDWPSQSVTEDCNGIISVDKIHIDQCGYLWVIDTGRIDEFVAPRRVCPSKILIYDLLNADNLVLRYEFPNGILNDRSSLATTVTDSRTDNCQDAIAYIADLNGNGLVIFNLAERTSRRINHNYFYPYPRHGTYTIAGVTFDLMDGVFGMALGPIKDNDRILYFHSLASLRESWISTLVLKNITLLNQADELRKAFHVSKEFRDGQSSLEVVTEDGIMIYSDLLKNALYCWNTAKDPINSNTQIILQENNHFQFISGMKLKGDKLWISSNRIQNIMANMNDTDYRYRIVLIKSVKKLLDTSGQKCL